MVVDYFSRFPVIRLLKNMISHTVCNHFKGSWPASHYRCQLLISIHQPKVPIKMQRKCHHAMLQFPIPPNSLTKRAIGTCKLLLLKALKEKECAYTALLTYRTTPLDDRMPSPHDLLLGCKPQTTLPGRKSILKYKHPDNDIHHKANQRRQQRQAIFYDRKAGSDKRPLSKQEPVFHVEHLEGYLAAGNCAKQARANGAPSSLQSGHSRNNLPENQGAPETKESERRTCNPFSRQ